MATILAYTAPAAGHMFPLMPGLLALRERDHEIHVRTQAELVDAVRAAGLHAEAVDRAILDVPVADYQAKRDIDRLRRGIHDMISRGPQERADLRRALEEVRPDVVLVDINAYGAAVAAQASGLPWAITMPAVLPLPGRGIPPYGLGMRPMRGPLGRLRDRALVAVLIRQYAKAMLPGLNALREQEGLPALTTPLGHMLSADRLLVMTGDPLEYPRTELPPNVRFVGAQLWDPPAETPAWPPACPSPPSRSGATSRRSRGASSRPPWACGCPSATSRRSGCAPRCSRRWGCALRRRPPAPGCARPAASGSPTPPRSCAAPRQRPHAAPPSAPPDPRPRPLSGGPATHRGRAGARERRRDNPSSHANSPLRP